MLNAHLINLSVIFLTRIQIREKFKMCKSLRDRSFTMYKFLILLLCSIGANSTKPNIIFILADDLVSPTLPLQNSIISKGMERRGFSRLGPNPDSQYRRLGLFRPHPAKLLRHSDLYTLQERSNDRKIPHSHRNATYCALWC